MKRTLMHMATAFVAMLAIGCTTPVDPPTPVKMYLTGSESFTRVDAAGTLAITDIYQWDGAGQKYTGSDAAVNFDSTYGTEWTITVGGSTYLNDANIGPTFTDVCTPTAHPSLDFQFVVQGGIVGNNILSGFESFVTMNPTYTGSNTITAMGGSLHTWTR